MNWQTIPLVIAATGLACLVVAAWVTYGITAGLVVLGFGLLFLAPIVGIVGSSR